MHIQSVNLAHNCFKVTVAAQLFVGVVHGYDGLLVRQADTALYNIGLSQMPDPVDHHDLLGGHQGVDPGVGLVLFCSSGAGDRPQ